MSAREDIKWWDAIKERVKFYGGISLCIVIDALFLLLQRAIVIGYTWCANRLHTVGESTLSTQHLLGSVFDWGSFSIVALWAIVDVIRIGRKIFKRMKET